MLQVEDHKDNWEMKSPNCLLQGRQSGTIPGSLPGKGRGLNLSENALCALEHLCAGRRTNRGRWVYDRGGLSLLVGGGWKVNYIDLPTAAG